MHLKKKSSKCGIQSIIDEPSKYCFNSLARIAVSFNYLTSDKNYKFDYFGTNLRKELDARKSLDELLKVINKSTWLDLQGLAKTTLGGFEKINYDSIKKSIFKNSDLTPDSVVYSFRFSSQNYRLIAFKYDKCTTLYVLGFDFDYSVYNHGS